MSFEKMQNVEVDRLNGKERKKKRKRKFVSIPDVISVHKNTRKNLKLKEEQAPSLFFDSNRIVT